MAVKAVNNTTGLDRLVPTLLVYKAYLRINNLDRLADKQTPFTSLFTYLLCNQTTNQAQRSDFSSQSSLISSRLIKLVCSFDI
jgi:hypothetical protein